MRFIVDECTGPGVAKWLNEKGHDVVSVYDKLRGADDLEILHLGNLENRMIITNDKDFGEIVNKQGLPNKGVILLRLEDETPMTKALTQRNKHYLGVPSNTTLKKDKK